VSDERSPLTGTAPPKDWRWKPGESGNPSGSPKGFLRMSQALEIVAIQPISVIRRLARGVWPDEFLKADGEPRVRCLTYCLAARQYLNGLRPGMDSTRAAEFIADRTEGKATQTVRNENLNVTPADLEGMSDEQLRALRDKLAG
jgi:hypothetical protein